MSELTSCIKLNIIILYCLHSVVLNEHKKLYVLLITHNHFVINLGVLYYLILANKILLG